MPKTVPVNGPTGSDECLTDFDLFWQAYPKHKAKADARKAWLKLKPTTELVQTILDALAWQAIQPDWTKDNRAFCPLPATYLRGERWEDEAPACHCRPKPTGEILELAKSIARRNAEDAKQGHAQIQQRIQQLMAQGLSKEAATFDAGREWLKRR